MPKIPTFQEDMASIGRAGPEEGCLGGTSPLSGRSDGPPRISSKEKTMRPRAVEWLYSHEDMLIARGWEQSELYGAEGVFGIGWSHLWEREDLAVKMNDTGCVTWSFTGGKDKKIVHHTWPNCVEIPFEEFNKF